MNEKSSRLAVVALLVIVGPLFAACGDDDDGADDGATTSEIGASSSDAATTTVDAALDEMEEPDETTAEESGGSTDGSNIDWATVDLTTIDWQNIDLSTVDFPATEDNPSVENLDEATVALIQQRFADEVSTSDGDVGSGEAILTIGDETWDFDGFVCARGYANTESDVFSFSTNAFGELDDGTRTQLQANIWDETGSDSITGPDTEHEVTFDDIENFDDPAVSWLLAGPEITVDGVEVSVEGTFRDLSTDAEADGSFVGECGPGSRL